MGPQPRARKVLAAGVGLLVGLAGCGHAVPAQVGAQRHLWEKFRSQDYQFTLSTGAMCGVVGLRIYVHLGAVTTVNVTQPGCGVSNATANRLTGVFGPRTIDGVFDEVSSDYRQGYGMKVTYDRVLGFPAVVAVDPSRKVIDDEYQINVSDYQSVTR